MKGFRKFFTKHKALKITIITFAAVLAGAGGLVLWYFRPMPVSPMTGKAPDEAYRNGTPGFYKRESYYAWDRGPLTEIPDAGDMGFDLRSYDVSGLSLADCADKLADVTFNSATVWPAELPDGFSPEEIMELGKNPGLGIYALHEMGFTGKGVSIAIIDQALNPDHAEYRDNIMGYELLHSLDMSAAMHGAAVASIAVGKNCGVAPDANLYYISSTFGTFTMTGAKVDLNYMADSIDRVLEINKLLPEDKKIRVISISRGFGAGVKGSSAVQSAIERAKKEGIFVITTSPDKNYDFRLLGLGREMTANPDDISSYGPGGFWKDTFYNYPDDYNPEKLLLVPMDARTYASWSDTGGYEFGALGGLSWSVPWLAGLYALCLEKNPSLTPDEFISKAFETGITRTIEHNGKSCRLGTIINPAALINEI